MRSAVDAHLIVADDVAGDDGRGGVGGPGTEALVGYQRDTGGVRAVARLPPGTQVVAWLAAHPRFHLHFTPTSSSWLNLVERWFRDLTDKAIRRGVFTSVPDLIGAIEEYLAAHNNDPKPFVWTAEADAILEKVRRGRVVLEQ